LYPLEVAENGTEELQIPQTISDSIETPQEVTTSPARPIRRRAATRVPQRMSEWTNILRALEDVEN